MSTDKQWTTGARVALMLGVVAVIAMLGSPWFHFAEPVAQQIITICGMVASAAVSHVFRNRERHGASE